jgi:hypothetical protein
MEDKFAQQLTDAIVKQSTQLERNSTALERFESRLATQISISLVDARTLLVTAIIVVGSSALVGACTALAWAGL